MLVTNDFNFTIYCLPYLVQSITLPPEREEALFYSGWVCLCTICVNLFPRSQIVEATRECKGRYTRWSIPKKSLVHTEELCSWSVPLEHAPGAKSLVCIGLQTREIWEKVGGDSLPLPSFLPFYFRVRALRLNFAEPTISKPEATYVLRDNRFLDDVYYKVEPSFFSFSPRINTAFFWLTAAFIPVILLPSAAMNRAKTVCFILE